MIALLARQSFHALRYDGVTYDCGDPIGLLRANVAYALRHPSLGQTARAALGAML
jgi:UTP--glucose-1-phosphate uridylyltransferase